jgi:arylsulfatase
MVEVDHRVGELVDTVAQLGIADNTLFIFASDNGPEFRRPWRGSAGMWQGTYHTAMEGGLRAPCMLRWPGHIPAGGTSNEIVQVTDLYTTLAHIAGAALPADRPIDGLDQLDFFTGKTAKSAREGLLFYIKTELRAAKWRDWKMHLVWEPEPNAGANHLESPLLFNLTRDPKEETDVNTQASWARTPLRRMIHDFQEGLKRNPPIPPGAPDSYVPAVSKG